MPTELFGHLIVMELSLKSNNMRTLSAEEYKKLYGETGVTSFTNTPPSTMQSRLAEVGQGNAEKISQAIKGEGQYADQNPLTRGIAATAAGFSTVPEAALAITPEPVRKTAEAVGGGISSAFKALTDLIGSNKQLQDWTRAHPEATAKIMEVAQGTSDLGAIASTIAGAEGSAKILTKGVDIAKNTISKGIDGLNTTSKVLATPIAKTIEQTVGQTVKPENIMQRVARIPKGAQAKFEQMSGESVGKYLTKRGIYGNTDEISEQLFKRFNESRNVADNALGELEGVYQPPILKDILSELVDREKRVSSPSTQSPDLAKSQELLGKYKSGGLTMDEINTAKRLYEKNVRLGYSKLMNPEGVTKATNADSALREWQFGQAKKLGLSNLDEINNETRLSKQLLDAIGKENAGSAGNNALGLTDWILLAGGDTTAIASFLTKKAFSSKGVQSAIAKKLYKGETIGKPKAKMIEPTVSPRKKQEGLKSFLKRN